MGLVYVCIFSQHVGVDLSSVGSRGKPVSLLVLVKAVASARVMVWAFHQESLALPDPR